MTKFFAGTTALVAVLFGATAATGSVASPSKTISECSNALHYADTMAYQYDRTGHIGRRVLLAYHNASGGCRAELSS